MKTNVDKQTSTKQRPTTRTPTSTQSATPEASDTVASGQAFVEAFEADGLDCTAPDPDRYGTGVVEPFVYRGDDHLVMTIRDYEDTGARVA